MVNVEKNVMRSKILWTLVGAVLALIVAAMPAAAQAKRPLPDFTVQGGNGPVRSSALVGDGRALLIYLQPDCRPCDTLVQLLGEWQSDALIARTVLLVAGDMTQAERVVKALPESVGNVRVYADRDGTAAAALQLSGAPVLVGIDERQSDWTVAGVLANVAMLESIVRSWVEVPQ